MARRLRVLLDEGVPIAVADVFRRQSHEALLHDDVLHEGAQDDVVAETAMANHAILVAIDRDMGRLAGIYGRGDPRFQALDLIKIACPEPMAASRIDQAMSFIDLEWTFAKAKPARRLYVEIARHFLRTYR